MKIQIASRKCFLVLVAALMLTRVAAYADILTTDYQSRTVFGYTTSGQHNTPVPYTAATRFPGVVFLNPTDATFETRPSQNFMDVLTALFPATQTRHYQSAYDVGSGLGDASLIVETYDARHGTPRGSDTVGAEFEVRYNKNPENNPFRDLHWIQVVQDNHAINGAHGTPEDVVDTRSGTSPYYDDGFTANSQFFTTFPIARTGIATTGMPSCGW